MDISFTGTYSGNFVSTGQAQFINLPAGCDWMKVTNETVCAAGGAGTGAEFFWRRGMAQGRGLVYNKTAVTDALAVQQIAANLGFFWLDTTVNTPGASIAVTGITGANPPVVQTGTTTGLIAGQSIVRIYSTVGALQLGGMDFTINNITPTSFKLDYMPAIANASPGAGSYRIIPFNPYFYPSTRYITKISAQAVTGYAIVTLSVNHTYVVGQRVTFKVPTVTALAYGMTQLNGMSGTIIATGTADVDDKTNTILVDIDVSGFGAFVLPLTTAPGFTPAMVIPSGETMKVALPAGVSTLGDAIENRGQTGLLLMSGTTGPAGVATNVISWIAGKSWNT